MSRISSSTPVPVKSGVPQGTVLGPILSLIYINDIVITYHCHCVNLFANDFLLYRIVQSERDIATLQSDLNSLAQWCLANKLNIGKCIVIKCSRT